LESIGSAEREAAFSPNDSASRSYYAAFNAVSALFALRGTFFRSHDAVEIAFHRDLVKPGIFSHEVRDAYKLIRKSRQVGDYGVTEDVDEDEAREAVTLAKLVLEAVYNACPDDFNIPPWMTDREE